MALPKLNTSPKYELTIPSTGEKAFFRPFLVKEQKVLMISYESNDRKQIVKALLDTVDSCLESDVDVYSLSTFDIDYMFTQIRGKSVGENVSINIKCSDCDHYNEVQLKLDDIEPPIVEGSKVIELDTNISLTLKYPSYTQFIRNPKILEASNGTEAVMEIIVACMDSIQTDEENIILKNESKEEIVKFLDSMSTSQFEQISSFVQDMPSMSKDVEFTCTNCAHENNTTLKGLDDFLS